MSTMLKLFFCVVSSLLVWSSARVLDSRQTTPSQLNMCLDNEAQVIPGTTLEIKSPNYDNGFYSTNTRCHVTLKSDSQDLLLTLNIKTLDLELYIVMCDFDYLCINGVRYCGNWASGNVFQYILPAYNEFTLNFKTDYSVNARGFDIVVSAAQYNNETVNIIKTGVGKDSSSLQTQPLTLDNLNYQDICGVDARETGISYPGAPSVYNSTTYYQYTTNNPWYYDSTFYYQYTTNNPWYYDSTSYYQYTTNNPWYYDSTSYYQYTTNNPWYYDSTSYYQYTTNNPWYYDSTSYYQYTTNYPWYYDSTSYYQYSTGYPYYYESTTYDPYSTGNPYYNPYTPVASAFPSKDYVASLVQQVIQQLNSERYSQEQASLLLTQLLRYLGY
ncbi:uncharacterized protein LOC106058571 [Biomphalaria glabrata]|uniref:Uncharacterized protein LOC106058571 n=1 Tax=Biomphalaria glabrata TaxID=6526 RepID=A0A9W2YJF0_BIOGL|nr:uncharacterized protein LOC106058571 [Biomphalaria glabrata]